MVDLGRIQHCLGMEVNQQNDLLTISQSGYIEAILKKFKMEDSKPISTPMDPNTKFSEEDDLPEDSDHYPFKEFIGSLMYLAIGTRPDIIFSVNYLSQFNNSYDKRYWIGAKRIVRYIRGSTNLGLK